MSRWTPAKYKTDYKKYFKFLFDFNASKTLFLEHEKHLTPLVMCMIAEELEKPEPFKGVDFSFEPQKHFGNALIEEGVKLFKLAQVLYNGRPYPMINLYTARKRVGFKKSDKQIMETCLYNLIESGMIEVIDYEYPNGEVYSSIRPQIALKRTNFSKKDSPTTETEIARMKKGTELTRKGGQDVARRRVKVGRRGETDGQETED